METIVEVVSAWSWRVLSGWEERPIKEGRMNFGCRRGLTIRGHTRSGGEHTGYPNAVWVVEEKYLRWKMQQAMPVNLLHHDGRNPQECIFEMGGGGGHLFGTWFGLILERQERDRMTTKEGERWC